ncbi:hypothetical protein P4O66_010524 [Electrophorus voltai]|uniref:Ig-like domain-containing protein n=1 Tax=Electrophorus voltai TaxID=2609070 RepID=A0AAD9DW43_9TELE|nr:hypothetical protein P4O66_010524 [Electrophorus voltai]
MSMTQTCLWISLALCIATGGSEMFYEKRGETVILNCGDAAANRDVEWKHKDSLIMSVTGKTGRSIRGSASVLSKSKLNQQNLHITSLEPDCAGLYSCTGYNSEGSKIITQHTLSIVSVTESAEAVLQSTLTLKCDITGDSTAQVQWQSPKNHSKFETGKEITVKSVSLKDAGEWVCQIKGEDGKERKKIHVNVAVVGPLESSKELTVGLGASAVLPCFLSRPSRLRIVGGGWTRDSLNNSLLTLAREKDLHWTITKDKMSRFTFPTHQLSTNFSVKLTNVQSADAGVYVCTLMFEGKEKLKANLRLKVEGEAVSRSSKTFWEISVLGLKLYAWVAIAAGSVILIILFVVIMFFYRRNKRMRRKVRKLKSMREPLTSRNYCQCNR